MTSSIGAGSAGRQDAGVRGSQRLPPRFQRMVWVAGQNVAGLSSCGQPLRRVIGEDVRRKPKLQWGPRDVSNVHHLLEKAAGSGQSQAEREAMWAATSRAVQVGLLQPLGASILPTCTLGAAGGVQSLRFVQVGFGLALVLSLSLSLSVIMD